MTTFYTDVPAHVQHADHVNNQVQVRGGTNWDLSRSAVATPITPMKDPEPKLPATLQVAPAAAGQTVVQFGLNSVVVPANAQKALKALPKGVTVTVDGYASESEKNPQTLSQKRANEVAARLRKQGTKVESAEGHGGEGLPGLNATQRRRVEVRVR